jgi:hypothetical protein
MGSNLRHNGWVDYADHLKSYLERGLSLQAALELLRNDGASPVEAVAAIRAATGVDQAHAQQAFQQSPAWGRPRVPSAGRPSGAQAQEAGQHGRSGHGSSSVLPHLLRQPPSTRR